MFTKFGNAKAVNKALERLVQQNKLYRISTGIYVLPVVNEYIGNVFPDIDTIAVAIAKRDKARIVPTGSYAMYKLGLTTQVPMNVVYYTDTSARKIKIDKQTITFKKASAKNLSTVGEISKLVIQALRTIGKGNATDEEVKHIKRLLQNENPKCLQHDLLLAPVWIRTLLSTTKTVENE
jgi:predicted transcriptional regulator of viral defense system